MPRGDGTGPRGMGPATGRGLGGCRGRKKPSGAGVDYYPREIMDEVISFGGQVGRLLRYFREKLDKRTGGRGVLS